MTSSAPLYNAIGTGYNHTRRPDSYITNRLFEFLSPQQNKWYLDIGCGTGNYTTKLAAKGANWVGVDPSGNMLTEARAKSDLVQWLSGTAENIPATDHQFDGAMATLTIHHWTDLEKAFAELCRVIKSDGRLVIFTATPEQMEGYWLNHYFPQMMQSSIGQMPSFRKVAEAGLSASFTVVNIEKYFIQDDLQDLFLYSGKLRPALYLDSRVRSGISSFAALAHREEVDRGLQQLELDLKNERLGLIQTWYDNQLGDYLFITMEKKCPPR